MKDARNCRPSPAGAICGAANGRARGDVVLEHKGGLGLAAPPNCEEPSRRFGGPSPGPHDYFQNLPAPTSVGPLHRIYTPGWAPVLLFVIAPDMSYFPFDFFTPYGGYPSSYVYYPRQVVLEDGRSSRGGRRQLQRLNDVDLLQLEAERQAALREAAAREAAMREAAYQEYLQRQRRQAEKEKRERLQREQARREQLDSHLQQHAPELRRTFESLMEYLNSIYSHDDDAPSHYYIVHNRVDPNQRRIAQWAHRDRSDSDEQEPEGQGRKALNQQVRMGAIEPPSSPPPAHLSGAPEAGSSKPRKHRKHRHTHVSKQKESRLAESPEQEPVEPASPEQSGQAPARVIVEGEDFLSDLVRRALSSLVSDNVNDSGIWVEAQRSQEDKSKEAASASEPAAAPAKEHDKPIVQEVDDARVESKRSASSKGRQSSGGQNVSLSQSPKQSKSGKAADAKSPGRKLSTKIAQFDKELDAIEGRYAHLKSSKPLVPKDVDAYTGLLNELYHRAEGVYTRLEELRVPRDQRSRKHSVTARAVALSDAIETLLGEFTREDETPSASSSEDESDASSVSDASARSDATPRHRVTIEEVEDESDK